MILLDLKKFQEILNEALTNETSLDLKENVEGVPNEVLEILEKTFSKIEEKKTNLQEVFKEINKRDLKFKKELRDRQQFLHILCHDLKNPVAGCLSYLTMMEAHPEKAVKYQKDIRDCLIRSLDIIDDVRNLLAVKEGKVSIGLEFINLKECIYESINVLQLRLEEKQVKANVDVDENIYVLANKSALVSSVFNNLLTNAIKFSPENSTINIKASFGDGNVHITFRDYGVGMPQTLLDNIFSPDANTSRKGTRGESGTGFGMPLVKRFVESFEAKIDVNSWDESVFDEGHGTEVKISFWGKRQKPEAAA